MGDIVSKEGSSPGYVVYIHVFNAGRCDHIMLMGAFNITAASIVSQGLSHMVEMGRGVYKIVQDTVCIFF